MKLKRDHCKTITASHLVDILERVKNSTIDKILSSYLAVAVLSTLYILLDILERSLFVYTCIANQKNAASMLSTALSSKVPGSYARKQMNIITFFGILTYVIIYNLDMQVATYFHLNRSFVLEVARYILVIGLVFRFILHIHSMRLIPGIGHFIITTFMMAENLIHFSTVLGIVILIFAALFHILINNEECPMEKETGFQDMGTAMLSTFQLTFGHGNRGPFFQSTPVILTYCIYMIIVSLLLMNLIIAIMSSTATEIMAEPWKSKLWIVDWLDEATSLEYTVCCLGSLCRQSCTLRHASHRHAGYIMREKGDALKIYIPDFDIPALEAKTMNESSDQ